MSNLLHIYTTQPIKCCGKEELYYTSIRHNLLNVVVKRNYTTHLYDTTY